MADMTELMQYKMLEDDNKGGGWGAGAFLWVILIFLFFLAFSGNGLFGRRGDGAMAVTQDLSQVERDVLTGNCGTATRISWLSLLWGPRCRRAAAISRRLSSNRTRSPETSFSRSTLTSSVRPSATRRLHSAITTRTSTFWGNSVSGTPTPA